MKFKKGQRSHKIPGDVGQVHSVVWEPNDRRPDGFSVWLITPNEMTARIKAESESDPPNPQGIVVYASIVGEEIIVSPTPDADGQLRLRYWGALREA